MRAILVLRGGALGDFIVTLPALAALHAHWPEARIEWVGNATAAQLAKNRGLLQAVHSQHESRWSALYRDDTLSGEFREWLGQFDLVVNYWPDPDGALARHFPVHSGQQFLTAPALPERAPAAAHYCEVLQRAGLPPSNFFYPLRALNTSEAPTSQRYAPAESPVVRSDALAVHPGSGSRKKNWPAVRWHELILALRDPVRLVCGEAEAEAWNGSALASTVLAERLRRGTLRLAVNQPLEQLIADFAHCRLFIGHDSGVSHLAAACGVPCVLLFGPTDPAVWAPPAPHVRVIRRTDELTSIRVEDVLAALPA